GGLKQSCTYGGKTFCVPYYAGVRAVIYRKDLYRSVGFKSPPKTYSKFMTLGKKLMKKYGRNPNFSALYEPGQNWYVAMSYVVDYGGQIAVRKGSKWQGTLNTPQAIAGLTAFKKMTRAFSRESKNKSLAADWVKAFTGTASETLIAKAGNIANSTTLLGVNAKNPALAPFARAATYSWFVPAAPNWVNVESSNLLKTMCTSILTN